jgi:predicted deacylase
VAWVFDRPALHRQALDCLAPDREIVEGGSAEVGTTVLVLGGIHGDEASGARLARRLIEHLLAHPEATCGRRVVVVPEANPDGLRRGTRRNAAGADINRNFPARNFRSGRDSGPEARSEPETRALLGALRRYDPAVVVALHAPLACVDPDGGPAAAALAREVSRAGGLPVQDLEALPGSLGSYVSLELGRSVITYEIESRRPSAGDRERHLGALLAAIAGAR